MFSNKTVFNKTELKSAYSKCRRKAQGLLFFKPKENQVKSAIIFFDLDHMKAVNDDHSHWMGDKVISRYLEILASLIRKEDALVRFGGDEVLVFMPNIVESVVWKKIQEVQRACLEDPIFVDLINKGMSVTAGSLLVTDFKKHTLDELIDKVSKVTKRAKFTIAHSIVKEIAEYDTEDIVEAFDKLRRNDEVGDQMRALFKFTINQLTRGSGRDSGIIALCCRDLWKERGLGILNEMSFGEISKEILIMYKKAENMDDIAEAYKEVG